MNKYLLDTLYYVGDECLAYLGHLDVTQSLYSCIDGYLGPELLLEIGLETKSLEPPVSTIIIKMIKVFKKDGW